MMKWSYFFDKYSELSDSKLRSYISLLESIDSGCELAYVVADVDNKDIKALLIQKAMEFEVEFDQDDFEILDGEIPSELYARLAREGNVSFGTSQEVAEVLEYLVDEAGREALYKRALKEGVKFTRAQLEQIGEDVAESPTAPVSHASNNVGCGCLGALLGVGVLFGNDSRHSHGSRGAKKDNGRCNGDCANCPPHYGYRYGRWYYGHGHQRGCQRGGNGGASGKCRRD